MSGDPNSRFCIDCGKPLTVSSARTGQLTASQTAAGAFATATGSTGTPAPTDAWGHGSPGATGAMGRVSPIEEALTRLTGVCPRCGKSVDPTLPYCGHCGSRIDASGETAGCESCGAAYQVGVDLFCARCGSRVGESVLRDAYGAESVRTVACASRARGWPS